MKKGMELSLNVIVIAAILLVTAIVLIIIFGNGVADFVLGLFNAGCQGKVKALCAPQGADDDLNKDGVSDYGSFSLIADNGVDVGGDCSQGQGTPSVKTSTKYNTACKDLAENNKLAKKNAGR